MAFIKTSDSIVIKATLTDEGKKLLSRGKFKIAKFALGDDEIDYELLDQKEISSNPDYVPALENTKLLESYSNHTKNIQFGLMSYDSGIVNLRSSELKAQITRGKAMHANILYIPTLRNNNKLDMTPTVTGSVICLSANDETTSILNKISGFNFLATNNFDNCRVVVESGLDDVKPELIDELWGAKYPTKKSREDLILKKHFLDSEFEILIDDRFLRSVVGISQNSKFENYQSGETNIKFVTSNQISHAISKPNEFENHATYILRTIPNLLFDWSTSFFASGKTSFRHSIFAGPRGSVLAFNLLIDDEMKVNSESTTNFKFTKYGSTDKIIFSELPTSKFDYIDTTIYVIGSSTNSRLSIPIRIVRYAGT